MSKKSLAFNNKKIKAILIDSGRVLNGPVTGSWFITPNFFNYVDRKKFNSISASQRRKALSKAGEYISKQNLIVNEEEEYAHFFEYYNIFSKSLPQLNLKEEYVKSIARDLVYNYNKYAFFKDGIELIPKLSKKYKLAVVSDAWPSLENVFINANLREYFSSFVISSIKGVTKPDELMYKTALEELDVSPEEAIFIDDSIKNCDGAINLGIKSFVLCRDWRLYIYNKFAYRNYSIIKNFYAIDKILG
ncbi:HAD-superfamily hydrolase [Clostridium pasteurianum DSM 525 = ATCC 6013]|uniref:HAD-superfamily hydrolase n=1 Tax=Clostridium pasteurianum DSM 525 = ATCC 6013 TaxID=1262449 RepID=A0A0H3IZU6_CLOPA|nr:HAD-IA family hydrolase [Clostridium pasteurianum]AJA47076.1 HAD-superfamily hydrolase [Clostridium pasteurianum DSM 525 = ATCC 6013]AJA51064.1 HAD-superfamily hydrolase [Clostridium pasteurianum DSM 525 = ATCC 6013]AOZ74439.1 HAD family hydrolase [Clostridium pasteurianum DSM 525 = ATCC 6013]AOZ78236.1 HAD family hydrolase [Clostridium pasteurianum]ELP59537.1 HAD-superfamily hydrolase [Clostridium pasteurianum DSM 525 = ATCC 6013]